MRAFKAAFCCACASPPGTPASAVPIASKTRFETAAACCETAAFCCEAAPIGCGLAKAKAGLGASDSKVILGLHLQRHLAFGLELAGQVEQLLLRLGHLPAP